ncbi:MAG: nucleotidyltransferase domain-containing protein [Candidatus Omnitrophota bacterium]
MHLKPEERTLVCDILRRHVPEYEVIAFGSRVHGRNLKPFSDLDLAVRSSRILSTEKLAAVRHAFSESDLSFKVDVIDWAETDENFRNIIEADYAVIQAGPKKT